MSGYFKIDKEFILTKLHSRKTRRQARILDALQLNPAKRVAELALELEVSAETVRRDLTELDALGQLQRTYGGAIRTAQFEPGLCERLKLHIAAREKIAKRTVELLDGVGSLFLGGGATTFHVARVLSTIDRPITVLTASFGIATELAHNAQIEVIFLPGRVEHGEGMVCGPETLQYISKYRTPIAIIGASSIGRTGVSEALLSAAQVYESMIASAGHSLVVADTSKLAKCALRLILHWNENTTLITDRPLDDTTTTAIVKSGASLQIAS